MSGPVGIPWERYALISELAYRLKGKTPQFGKTMLQKLVFLLQELYDVKCGYRFALYTYGPFSPELHRDLEIADALGGVEVQIVGTGLGGYHIAEGSLNDKLRERGKHFLKDDRTSESLDQLVNEFAGYSAKALELRSTVVFVYRNAGIPQSGAGRRKLVELVKDIKPRFPSEEIQEAVAELEKKEHISFE